MSEPPRPELPRLLASVRDVAEAQLAASLGAEVIDMKEPRAGALGAVALDEQRRILAALGAPRPTVSATVGDLPFDARLLAAAIRHGETVGVDIVKFGVFAGGRDARSGFAELGVLLRERPPRAQLVALLLADRLHDIDEACSLAGLALAVHGVGGVMLDTAEKGPAARSLPELFSTAALRQFVVAVHGQGGFAGLAGSLRSEHVLELMSTGADLMGFRGALCAGGRNDRLDAASFARLRDQFVAARAARSACGLASNTTRVATPGSRADSSA